MACRIQYLDSTGVHPDEAESLNALSGAFPEHWAFYASFQCLLPRAPSIQIDALLAMEDRLLLLELRRMRDEFTVNGDRWVLPNGLEKRSPVAELASKATKLKGLLLDVVQGWPRGIFVDTAVVLTGGARGINLPPEERARVLSLEQACGLADPGTRRGLLQPVRLSSRRPCDLKPELDHAFRNARFFKPSEKLWQGYRVVREDVVVHPGRIWREHLGEKTSDERRKALVRVWQFDLLPPSFNTREARERVAGREAEAIARLAGFRSPLAKDGLLLPEGADPEDFLTNHSELRTVDAGAATLHGYLTSNGHDMAPEDRRLLGSRLLAVLRDLHLAEVAHRDLGLRNIWVGGPTSVALTGLHVCWMPGDEMAVEDFAAVRYHRARPPVLPGAGHAKAADTVAVAAIVADILRGAPSRPGVEPSGLDGSGSEFLGPWVERALRTDGNGFADGQEALAAFGDLLDSAPPEATEPRRLDVFRTLSNPYAEWLLLENLGGEPDRHMYIGRRLADGLEGVVTVWAGWNPGASTSSDLALARLLEGARRLAQAGMPDLPTVIESGLSPVGPYVVTERLVLEAADGTAELDQLETAAGSLAVLRAVDAMHGLDIEHGDLGPSSFGLATPGRRLVLRDPFGRARGGPDRRDGPDRPAEAARAADRRAALSLAADRLRSAGGPELKGLLARLEEELGRGTVETLESPIAWLSEAVKRLSSPPRRQMRVRREGSPETSAGTPGEQLFCRATQQGPDRILYTVTGTQHEILLDFIGGRLARVSVGPTRFASLEFASRSGTELALDLVLTPDGGEGDAAILDALSAVPIAAGEDTAAGTGGLGGTHLDVRALWQASLDLEEQRLPTVELTRTLGDGGDTGIFEYGLAGPEIDFDDDDQIEAAPEGGRPIAELILAQLGPSSLALRYYGRRRFVAGDRVVLQDKRGRDSFQRRRRAVGRILEGEAAVGGLLGYLGAAACPEVHDYRLAPSEAELAPYRLNKGQLDAFRHVVRYGPVNLQQGPPGTGKTRFIAALVHWLTTRAGAERILIASQGHEAVNNAVEALADLHRELGGGRPNVLRIGTKNITPKVRPFDSSALRERYRARFDAAARSRVVTLAAALGISRGFARAAFEIEANLGTKLRRLSAVAAADEGRDRISQDDRRRDGRQLAKLRGEAEAALEEALGFAPGRKELAEALDLVYGQLAREHGELPPAEVATMRSVLGLAAQWTDSLAVRSRNFEEFLAKTRPVLAATCVGAGQTKIRIDARPFDWVIVDEAARCTPGELAVPVHLGRRVLLVGDHLQLKPMLERDFLTELGSRLGTPAAELSRSDFERAITGPWGRANARTFDEQYRMAEPICCLVSTIFYEPNGITLATSGNRRPDPAFAGLAPPLDACVTWIDTSTSPDNREQSPASDPHTFYNDAEVGAAMALLRKISRAPALVRALEENGEDTPVGIICMYKEQVERMRGALAEQTWPNLRFGRLVRVETVDSYQGKENSIVIMSLVRSNPGRLQGHVASDNRCNVALSRAKERLYIVGAREMWARCRRTDPMRRVWSHLSARPAGTQIVTPEAFA